MELYGNKNTYNLENVLRLNIVDADYYRDTCLKLGTWEEVVDEVYYDVQHVEPWMSGNARGASTAFCLMYRLFTLKMSTRQIKDLLQHPDSPYIRAVGFLYLRYVGDPKMLWSWCEPFLTDDQELTPSPGGPTVTIGEFIIDILLCQYYFETIFPRIPKKVMDEIIKELKRRGLRHEAKGNGGAGGADRRGVDEPNRRPASVKASLSVAFGQRAPNRSNAREDGRARDPSFWAVETKREADEGRREGFKRRSRSRSKTKSKSKSPSRSRDFGRFRRGPPRDSRERDTRDRGRDRERDRSVERVRRDRRRSRSPHSPVHRRVSKEGNSRSKHHRGQRDSRARFRSHSRERIKRRTSRDNSQGARGWRGSGASRDVRDVFKESAPSGGGGGSGTNQIKMVYGS